MFYFQKLYTVKCLAFFLANNTTQHNAMSLSSSFSRDSFIDDSGSLFDSRTSSRLSSGSTSTSAATSSSASAIAPLPTPTPAPAPAPAPAPTPTPTPAPAPAPATAPKALSMHVPKPSHVDTIASSTSFKPNTSMVSNATTTHASPTLSTLSKMETSSSPSVLSSASNTVSKSLSTAKEAVENTLASTTNNMNKGLSTVGKTLSDTTNTLTSTTVTSVNSVKTFITKHWKTMVVLAVCVLVIVLLYVLFTSPSVQSWWKNMTGSKSSKTNKMVLPRDGKTNVVATERRTNKYITKKKKPNKEPSAPPRPDPKPISPNDKEVFNISNNIYTYDDAPAVCKAFGSRLATSDEVQQAFKKGADWCNYGWTDGQMALYPTQKTTFDKLQNIEGHEHDCGVVGVNGGYFQNPDLQFGVNCYGKKPEPRLQEKELIGYFPDYVSEKEKRMQERVAEIKQNMGELMVTPFNSKSWDEHRTVSERVDDWMKE